MQGVPQTCVHGVRGVHSPTIVIGLAALVLDGLVLAGAGLDVAPGPRGLRPRRAARAVEELRVAGAGRGVVPPAGQQSQIRPPFSWTASCMHAPPLAVPEKWSTREA